MQTTGAIQRNARTYPEWRREADRLRAAGEAILSDRRSYGPHLDNIAIGEIRINSALSNLSRAVRWDDEAIREEAEVAKQPSRYALLRAPARHRGVPFHRKRITACRTERAAVRLRHRDVHIMFALTIDVD